MTQKLKDAIRRELKAVVVSLPHGADDVAECKKEIGNRIEGGISGTDSPSRNIICRKASLFRLKQELIKLSV